MFKYIFTTLLSSIAICSITQVHAHDFNVGNIQISHPFARATMPGQASGAAFLSLENKGTTNDKLIKVESNIAKSIEIHSMEMVNKGGREVMQMREMDSIDLSADSKLTMKPGGQYHIMLIGLAHPLTAGEKFPMTLQFEKAGKIEVAVEIEAKAQAN